MQTVMTVAWLTACLWRGIRWDRQRVTRLPTQATGACAAFALTVLPFGPATVHHSGWIAALALSVAWLGRGYYGAAFTLGHRLARLAVPLATAAIASNLMLAIAFTDPHSTMLRKLLLVHPVTLGLAVGMALLAGAGARVLRWRDRTSLVLLAIGAASTVEAALVNIQTDIQGTIGSPVLLTILHTVAELACLAALLLPLAPGRRSTSRHLQTSHTLEHLWRLLAPEQAPIRIDDHADFGTWTSDAVIAIRDRLAELQRLCPRAEFEFAEYNARRDRKQRQAAHTVAAARCVQVALRAEHIGSPPVADPVNLMGLGGHRWLNHEVSWLVTLYHELHRIAAVPPPTGIPETSPLTDAPLVQQCERRLAQWFPGPLPASIAAVRAAISQRRDRPIGVTISDSLPARALVAAAADVDLVFLDGRDTELMKIVNEAHELGHLVCGHPGTVLRRCTPGGSNWTTDPVETEAEIIGRLIARHLLHAPGAGLAAYLEER